MPRRDLVEWRGFFLQGETDEGGHRLGAPSVAAGRFRCNPAAKNIKSSLHLRIDFDMQKADQFGQMGKDKYEIMQ
jgi:hypothetical protein